MDRVGHVALVAHELRQQTIAGPTLSRLVLGREPLGAQPLQIGHRPADGGPELGEEGPIAAEAVVVHDGKDELTPGVKLRQPFATIPIHAVRQVPVRGLIIRVAADEVTTRPHECPVADTRAGITAGTPLQGGTLTTDHKAGAIQEIDSIREAHQPLSRYLERIEQGAEIIITRRGTLIARVLPII